LTNPAEIASLHGGHVLHKSSSEISGVNVQLEDGKDLVKQLLLMQVVELKGGVHSVDDGVLVDKSWEGLHDSLDKGSRVAEVIHDMGARNHVVSAIHAIVKSGNTVDVVILLDVDHVVRMLGFNRMSCFHNP
jgi:hypothetical protein